MIFVNTDRQMGGQEKLSKEKDDELARMISELSADWSKPANVRADKTRQKSNATTPDLSDDAADNFLRLSETAKRSSAYGMEPAKPKSIAAQQYPTPQYPVPVFQSANVHAPAQMPMFQAPQYPQHPPAPPPHFTSVPPVQTPMSREASASSFPAPAPSPRGTNSDADKNKKAKAPPEKQLPPDADMMKLSAKLEKMTGSKFVPVVKADPKLSNSGGSIKVKDKSIFAVEEEPEPPVKRSPSDLRILNFGSIKDIAPPDPNELAYTMASLVFYSLHDHVEFKNGEPRVDYKKWAKSETFAVLEDLATHLQKVDIRRLKTYEEQLSFWINVHNVLTFHACANHGSPDKDRKTFFSDSIYKIGDHLFSINDIALGILRENTKKQFAEDDPRKQFIVMPHPCIHFALVQATKSSPPFGIFTPNEAMVFLQWVTYTFLDKEVDVWFARNTVALPKLFQENQKDFGKDISEVLAFVSDFLSESKSKTLQFIMTISPEVQYKEYEWTPIAPNLLFW